MSVMSWRSQFIRTLRFFFTWKVVFIYFFIDLFSFCIFFYCQRGDSRVVCASPLCFPSSSITAQSSSQRSGEHRRRHNQSHRVALITGPRTAAHLSPPPPEMSAGALCLWLVLALRHGCVTPLAIPQDRRSEGPQGRPESIMSAASMKQETHFHLRDLPRGPAVAPHKRPPQFMLDLFNVVSVSHGTLKSQKEILDGSIVRSFEDKGQKKKRFILLFVITHLSWHEFPISNNYARRANIETRGHAEFHHRNHFTVS